METLKAALAEAGMDVRSLRERWPGDTGPIYSLAVPGAEAIARWRQARALVDRTGHWPVLLGPERSLQPLSEVLSFAGDQRTADLLADALALDVPAWLQDSLAERFEDDEDDSLEDMRDPDAWNYPVAPTDTFVVPINLLTGELYPAVHLALLPTTVSWQTPLLLRFGGWNYCPTSEEHAAIFRHWEARYGAEVVALTHDTVEMAAARPPTDRDSAIALAIEQYAYCPDIVEQGTGSIDLLAAGLLDGATWFFWWD